MLSTGPAVERGRRLVYRRPTLSTISAVPAGAMIVDRADYKVEFAFTEPSGETVTYGGLITQDDLFRALHAADLLHRETR